MNWELAQVNIARLRAPLDDPALADFVALLEPVNAAADRAPGFVWRLMLPDVETLATDPHATPGGQQASRRGPEGGAGPASVGNATAIRAFEWDEAGSAGVIVNLTVWESVEALSEFTYGELHRTVLRRRREWFERMSEAHMAAWWVPAGHRPSTAEAEERVRHLRAHGPSATAFTLQKVFPAAGGSPLPGRDDWLCPV
jgi:hypothetical protein